MDQKCYRCETDDELGALPYCNTYRLEITIREQRGVGQELTRG